MIWSSYGRQYMKKFFVIIILSSVLLGCERIPDSIKQICGTDSYVLSAVTDSAAEKAYEACVKRYGY